MPVLGLQKGKFFSADVSMFYCTPSSARRQLLRHGYNATFLKTHVVTNLIEQDYLKENIVIAVYGTQLTLHRHQTKRSTAATIEERRLPIQEEKNFQKPKLATIRRLSLNLNCEADEYGSCDEDKMKMGDYFDQAVATTTPNFSQSRRMKAKDRICNSSVKPMKNESKSTQSRSDSCSMNDKKKKLNLTPARQSFFYGKFDEDFMPSCNPPKHLLFTSAKTF